MSGWQGYQYIAFTWAMFAFASPFVFARLYVQFRLRIHPWREVLVIVAYILFLATCVLTSLENDWNNFNQNYDAPSWYSDAQQDRFWDSIEKAIFAAAFTYKPSIYACKAALLLFYADVSPKTLYPKTWWSIRLTWIFVICGCLLQILMNLFDCWPFHLNWSATHGNCGYRNSLLLSSWSLHTFTDIQVYAIPFVILYNLKNLSKKQRRGAAIMFALGGLNVICATFVVVSYALPWDNASYWYGLDACIMFMLSFQQATAIILVCMPQIRRLYQLVYAEKRREAERKGMPSDRRYGYGSSGKSDVEASAGYYSKYSNNATSCSKTVTATVIGDGDVANDTGSEVGLNLNVVKVTKEVTVESTATVSSTAEPELSGHTQ